MKTTWIAVLLGLAAMSMAAASYAAPVQPPAAAKPVTVTVAVKGFVCQMCPDGLRQDLTALPGVTAVQATLAPAQVTAKLDEAKITVSQFVAAIATHPTAMDAGKTYGARLLLYVDTQMCANEKTMCADCFTEIPKRLKAVSGVQDVTLDATGKMAAISFTRGASVKTSDLINALQKSDLGFSVSTISVAQATKDAHAQMQKGSTAASCQ
jgi:copper chaperone CopZ